MPRVDILRSVDVQKTPRLLQMEGMFDVPPSQRSEERWSIDLDLPDDWNVGVIVGPSGAGKTTVARELFGADQSATWTWPEDRCVLDGFPEIMSVKDIVALLSSVGFSSPPAWVRPFRVLSNGEQFRVNLARTLAESPELAIVDEFTSVVDRTVAKIGSAAVAKTVRRRNQKFIAVTCHYDVLDWLEPDWVFEPHTGKLERGCLRRRPAIDLEVIRTDAATWNMFRKHHYLDHELNSAAACFVALWEGKPVAFSAWLHFPHPKTPNMKREHRTVCLPDFQGVGLGNALSSYCASMILGIGCRAVSITTHPSMVRSRAKSTVWKMTSKPNNTTKSLPGLAMISAQGSGKSKGIPKRLRASFEYVGPAMDASLARSVWGNATGHPATRESVAMAAD